MRGVKEEFFQPNPLNMTSEDIMQISNEVKNVGRVQRVSLHDTRHDRVDRQAEKNELLLERFLTGTIFMNYSVNIAHFFFPRAKNIVSITATDNTACTRSFSLV